MIFVDDSLLAVSSDGLFSVHSWRESSLVSLPFLIKMQVLLN